MPVFCFLIMAIERDDSLQSVSVRLGKKNYSYWSYVMRNVLKGKKLWGYVIGTSVKPKSTRVFSHPKLESLRVCNFCSFYFGRGELEEEDI